jgi:hypothetical protein
MCKNFIRRKFTKGSGILTFILMGAFRRNSWVTHSARAVLMTPKWRLMFVRCRNVSASFRISNENNGPSLCINQI